jgi:hypothetical protein
MVVNSLFRYILIIAAIISLSGGFAYVAAAKIEGTVRNAQSQELIENVTVSIEGTATVAKTDSKGYFFIDSVLPGSYNLLFNQEKFEALTLNDLFIAGDQEKTLKIELNPLLQKLEKVVVVGNVFRKPPEMSTSTKSMNFDEILRSPGALVDVQRVVQDLPSVSSGGDNTNEIIVRGGNPGENLLIMDNVEIPNPNNFASQGSGGGVVSLINPLLVKGLVFCAGAPPALYGGKASSVLDVKLRDGNDKMVIGGVDLGMAGAGVHAEGPLWKGATFMASGTKSFLDLFAHYAKTTAIPEYWGLQAKLVQNAGVHKLSANVLYGDNAITIGDANKEAGSDGDVINSGGMVYATGVNLESKWNSLLSTTLTFSGVGNSFDRFEHTDSVFGTTTTTDSFFVNKSVEQEQSVKFQSALSFEKSKLQFGAQFRRCDFNIDIWERPDTIGSHDTFGSSVYQTNVHSRQVAYKYGTYLSGIFYPLQNLKIVPGIRADGFTFNNSTTVSPRLGLVYSLLPSLDITGAAAVQYQDPDYTDLVIQEANRDLKPTRVLTGIGGFEYSFKPQAAKFSIEGYYKEYDDLPVDSSLLTKDNYDQSDRMYSIGEGYSYGLELFLQKKLTQHFSGSFAYSLSRAFNKDPRPDHDELWYRSDYDFRNALTVTAGYKTDLLEHAWYKKIHSRWWVAALSPILPIADRVELSAKWRYLGGRPYTEPEWDESNHRYVYNQAKLNASQYPDYHRLDIRIERRYGFGLLQMIYYFDLQNIYDKRNIWMYLYSNKNHTTTPIYQFSFFPAGGVIIGF